MNGGIDTSNPDNDLRVGSASGNSLTDPQNDFVVGQRQQPPPDEGILSKSWHAITGIPAALWGTASGIVQGARDPNQAEARNAGFNRGLANVNSTLEQSQAFTGLTIPSAIPGGMSTYTPILPVRSQEELDAKKNQNSLERAAFDKQYGDNPVAQAYQGLGEATASAPLMWPLAAASEVGFGALGGGLADITGATAARGASGFAARQAITAAERTGTGAVTGGAQAAAAADPAKDFWDQVAPAMAVGGFLGPTLGIGADAAGNVAQRLRGNYVPVNPYTGKQFGDITEKADNAQTLIDANVPVSASQVSPDKALQFTSSKGAAIPFSGIGTDLINQVERFRSAVLKRVNPDAAGPVTNANAKFLADADAAIEGKYNNSIGAVKRVESLYSDPTTNTTTTISQDLKAANDKLPMPNKAFSDRLDAIQRDFANNQSGTGGANSGAITGAQVQDIIQRSENNLNRFLDNPDTAEAAKAAQETIRKRAMAAMTEDQRNLYAQANQQYRALNTVKTVKDSNGSFTPGDLYAETQNVGKKFGGTGVLDDLAKAGDSIIQPTIDMKPPTVGAAITGGVGAGALPVLGTGLGAKLAIGGSLGAGVGTGAAGLSGGGGLIALNRYIQMLNRTGGQNAINAIRAGGVNPGATPFMRAVGPTALNTQTLLGTALDQNQPQDQR